MSWARDFRNRGESPLVGDIVDYTKEGESDGSIIKLSIEKMNLFDHLLPM